MDTRTWYFVKTELRRIGLFLALSAWGFIVLMAVLAPREADKVNEFGAWLALLTSQPD